MADHERSSTKHQRGTHLGQSRHPEDSHKFESRSDRDDSYNSHGSFRTSREERTPPQVYPQMDRETDRRRHSQYDHGLDRNNQRYADSEDRLSGLAMKDNRWTSHDRSKVVNSRSHERVGDAFYERESSNGYHKTNLNTANERRRPIREQERYDRKDDPPDLRRTVHEKRHHRDSEHFQKSHDNYKHKEEEQEYQKPKSPAYAHTYTSSDVTSLNKDRGNSDDLDQQTKQYPSAADRRSEQRHRHKYRHYNSSHGPPSPRGSSRSWPSASDDTDNSRDTDTPKEGSFPSHSRSRARSESRHRGRSRSRSPSKDHSSLQKYNQSSHSHKHSGKRKHKDRSTSRDDRKRRKHKEKEREKDKEKKKGDEERRSVLTGKKIKLKVKKDKGDHERDANRKDLLQFLNSTFE